MKNVLIVDNDVVALHTFAGLLQGQGGLIKVLTANSLQAATEVMARQPIHMVITGLQLSEGDGFKLVVQLARDHPDIRVIVMTHNASPIFRAEIKQFPTTVNFDQVEDISMLPERIFTELQIEYGGKIRGVSLSSFMQMMELEKCSCDLMVGAKARHGHIGIRRGAPYAASIDDLRGNAAVLEMLTWENVQIDIDYANEDLPKSVTESLVSLIMESGRKIDEKQAQNTNQRNHQRFICLVAVDYDISNWTYQCFLRDISEGGAYIETTQPLKHGQALTLTLSSPSRNHSCIIQCEVTRRDDEGVGVQFDTLDWEQKLVIQDISVSYCQ